MEEFDKMKGFHRLESLWKIEYRATVLEPFITQTVSEEAKEDVDAMLEKKLPKTIDSAPLLLGDVAVITGNTLKGIFRHLISAQLTEAGHKVCLQKVKLPKSEDKDEKEGKTTIPGRKEQCSPEEPCFACTWFGTASRQGALYFSFLRSLKRAKDIILDEPIPMIALDDRTKATAKRAFMLIVPVREGTEFKGWIKGENLTDEIIGAIKEVVDMSEKGFVQLGGYKTRGFGTISLRIDKIEEYSTTPFKLKQELKGEELSEFLKECQKRYYKLLGRDLTGK
jgi:CRISPR/Cas system CSM-associated protein Csm3 (group 7 of RAMP superfamily)